MTNTFPPGGVELASATSAFSKMNEDGLCGACEVLMLRPIEDLLLLQPSFMIKCHLSDHPLSPTYLWLSLSCCLSVCYSVCAPCCFCCLVLFFVLSFSPLSSRCVSLLLCQFPLFFSLYLPVGDFATLSSCPSP